LSSCSYINNLACTDYPTRKVICSAGILGVCSPTSEDHVMHHFQVTRPTKKAGKSGSVNAQDKCDWMAGKVKVEQSRRSVAIWSELND
jgi:hypothetical protein